MASASTTRPDVAGRAWQEPVVAPETSPQTGHAALMAAGHRGDTDDEAARQRWELDGGPVTVGV